MEEKVVIEQFDEDGLTRRELVKRTAAAGLGLAALGALSVEPALGAGKARDLVRWTSPRGSIDVMDDYNLVVPIKMGYFRDLNLDVKLFAGDAATGATKFVAAKQADVGYPSPGLLTFSLDAGLPVYSIWEMFPGQVFDFALPADSTITKPQELAGKTISLFSIAAWKPIVDPMLAEVGVDPSTVTYRELGTQWIQAAALGQVDAALAWEGLRGQLLGTETGFGTGIKLKFLIGQKWGSKHPSNVYVVRKADLSDPKRRDIYTRFLAGSVMGFEFAKANPRAAAQITYNSSPALQQVIAPQVALRSMVELASIYGAQARVGKGWGTHDVNAWAGYLKLVAELGQTKKEYKVSEVLTNAFVGPANRRADVSKARRDAAAFQVDQYFKATKIPAGLPL